MKISDIKIVQVEVVDEEFSSDHEHAQDSDESISETSSFDESDDDDFIPQGLKKNNKQYNTVNLAPVSAVADRYGVSSTIVAAVATATLQSVNLVTKENSINVIDKKKVQRSREKLRESLRREPTKEFIGLFFDGRKDKTLFLEKGKDKILHKVFRKEEHISVIGEPGGNYLGHAALQNGEANSIVAGLTNVVDEKADFCAIGCDGTVVNTGHKAGVIRLYELKVKHPIQWIICQLHFNELPLRALFLQIDGPTTGPGAFSGDLGKSLNASVALPIVKFKRIPVDLLVLKHGFTSSMLSTDQQYLYDISSAISNGVVSPSLALRQPGKIHNSRWLTLANNVLRTYVGTKKPSTNLLEIVTYILKVYVPGWFKIKLNHKCVDGPSNLLYIIHLSRYLKKNIGR